MDTLTHALSGVLLARATRRPGARLSDGARSLACAGAAAFPDLDYLLILLDPLAFLNLHRGPTHSLVLLPLWAGLLALPLARMTGGPGREYALACALGLLAHIAGDWATLYGTQLFYPLSAHAYALGISYDFNPWIGAVAVAGCLAGAKVNKGRSARLALAVIALLLAGQALLRHQALAVAAAQARAWGLAAADLRALPQPLSPFHWGLMVADARGYRLAYLDQLAGPAVPPTTWLGRLAAGYRPEAALAWSLHPTPGQTPLADTAWRHPRLAAFRRFAQLPALYRIDRGENTTCVWFTDLRHALPGLPPPFRYGVCRAQPGAAWHPYRLRYFTRDQRQAL